MKQPLAPGTEISLPRISDWVDNFGSYRHQVTDPKIERWLRQFSAGDQDLAARLLDVIDFVGHTQMSQLFRQMLGAIPGWDLNPKKRSGRWRFAPYSTSSGQSGDSMIHSFRLANNLDSKANDELFIRPRDLLAEQLKADDTVVLIDDFSGTGRQVCDSWERPLQELLPSEPRTFIMLLAASSTARLRIIAETPLRPIIGFELTNADNLFNEACTHFSTAEKKILLRYCRRARGHNPTGFGDCGFVVVFAHRCPNNSLPILHKSEGNWAGLFPRHD
jgi:hypothetical protein